LEEVGGTLSDVLVAVAVDAVPVDNGVPTETTIAPSGSINPGRKTVCGVSSVIR
jgi:hypothetical protein